MYVWTLLVDDTPVRMVQLCEYPRWHLKHLQLRCVLAEYVEVDKWRRCHWTLEMGGCPVFSQDDKPAIVRREWRVKPWHHPDELRIYVHEEELLGATFCSRDVSFCIPMLLLFGKLDSQVSMAASVSSRKASCAQDDNDPQCDTPRDDCDDCKDCNDCDDCDEQPGVPGVPVVPVVPEFVGGLSSKLGTSTMSLPPLEPERPPPLPPPRHHSRLSDCDLMTAVVHDACLESELFVPVKGNRAILACTIL